MIVAFLTKIKERLKSYNYKHINVRLIIWLYALLILGLNVIASATKEDSYESKQLFGIIVGTVAILVLILIDYHFILKFYWLIYLLTLVLLLAVKFFGKNVKGAQRWFEFGPIQIQPSEFAKILLVIFFAKLMWKYKDKFNTPKVLLLFIVTFAVPLFLILKQPDLSTSIVICVCFCVMMYIGGLSYKIIAGVFAVAVPAVVIVVYLLLQPDQTIMEQYQVDRLLGFFDEDNEVAERINYQQTNSLIAIGSGGIWGKGLNNDREDSVKNGNYISEAQTDFIFTIVGEELGFVGTMSVIILVALICFECFYMGAHAPDLAGRIICCGIGAIIGFQAFVNMCVATKLLPNTGLPLPFVSYGLSSLLSLMAGMGVVLNVGLQHKKLLD